MKHVFFAIVLALTSQFVWGMDEEVVPLESALQFVSVYHSGFHSQIDTPAKLYDARPGHGLEKIKKITSNTCFTKKDTAGNHETQCVVDVRDKTLILTDLKTKKTFALYDPEGPYHRHTRAAFNLDGSLLAVGYRAIDGKFSTVSLWNTAMQSIKGKAFNPNNYPGDDVTALAFNPVKTELAVGCNDGTIKLWNYETGRTLEIQGCHAKAILALAYNRLRQLASSSKEDSMIKIWDTTDTANIRNIQTIQLDEPHDIIGFYPNESSLFSCNRYKTDKVSYHKVDAIVTP